MSYTELILQQPASGGWLNCREALGHTIAVTHVHDITEEPDTMNPGKNRWVADASLVDLDDGTAEFQDHIKIDKPGIVNRLKNAGRGCLIDGKGVLLGTITQGVAKPGQSAPFLLGDHTEDGARRFAQEWWPRHRDQVLSAGAPHTQPAGQTAPAAARPAPVAPSKWIGEQTAAKTTTPAPVAAPGQVQLPLGPDGNVDPTQMTPEAQALLEQLRTAGLISS